MNLRRIATTLVVLGLTGCATVPLSSLPALSRIDPETTDMSALRVAFVLPRTLRPKRSGVIMDVVARLGTQEERTGFQLAEAELPASGELPGVSVPEGAHLLVFRLGEEEVARFNALRAGVFQARSTRAAASIGLGIATKEFCAIGPAAPGPLPSDSYIMTRETGRYVAVTRNFDLRSDKRIAADLNALDPC